MKKYGLNEDKLPTKLLVRFSSKISKKIDAIDAYNQDNIEALSHWADYLNGIRSYLSNPVIAWDYTGRFSRFPNGAKFIKDFNYNVGYTIQTNSMNQTYVYIFKLNLNLEEFGLKLPPNVTENSQQCINRIISESINKSINEIIDEDRQRRIQRIVRETIDKYINKMIA